MQSADISRLQFGDTESGIYTRALAAIAPLVTDRAVWAEAQRGVKCDFSGQLLPAGQIVSFQYKQSQMLWGLNKFITAPLIREQIATAIAATERAHAGATAARASHAETESSLERFRADGIVELPPLLTHAEIKDVIAYIGDDREVIPENSLRHYLVKDIVHAPHILRAVAAPRLMALVEDYLGMPPTLMDISLWESMPERPEPWGAQIFHRDRDDFRACKLFVYLNDVGPDQGPHIFVRGSHSPAQIMSRFPDLNDHGLSQLFEQDSRRIAPEMEDVFGDAVTELTGPAGATFLENTYGFHRGKVPIAGSRLILQAVYACIPYAQRIARMAPGRLTHLPPGCADTAAARHALRLLL